MGDSEGKSIAAKNRVTDSESTDTLCFMEAQFPVSKLSKESYTERKSVAGQTLTALGKWWGRKPLVLCRAIILGLLLPATSDPTRDRDVFLRLMTMDDDGTLRRKSKSISEVDLFRRLGPPDRARSFTPDSKEGDARLKNDLTRDERIELQRRVFLSMPYDERLEYCVRPEQIDGPSADSWRVINKSLGTSASSISELVTTLGRGRFGGIPRIGDSFCGGGSVPFEAARIGCAAYGSDLNPVAALLTWAGLNIIGAGHDAAQKAREDQRRTLDAVDRQVTDWGIEHREPDAKTGRRWRADAYLYCVEVTCPECGWRIPLAPSWVIAEKTRVVAKLIPDDQRRRFEFDILENASDGEMGTAKNGSVGDSELICPHCLAEQPAKARTPIRVIRGDGRGTFGQSKSLLRGWGIDDVAPRDGDVFGERLYCIRWVDRWTDEKGKDRSHRYYRAPTSQDLAREQNVLALLKNSFGDWQKRGYIPSRRIEPGNETTRLGRERGWTHWHHLFTPRQLLINGLFATQATSVPNILLLGRMINANSRLSRWKPSNGGGIGGGVDVFSNQALNTLYNFSCRPVTVLGTLLFTGQGEDEFSISANVQACDARDVRVSADIWITDPPYADAVNYDELSEYFLAWYEGVLPTLFPNWHTDSKRALAVRGSDGGFRKSMVECYRVLVERMPDNGWQVVMFTHQDASVWADLTLILWAAGLRVAAAWCIATETPSSQREGNYVQGTVLLVLRKQKSQETVFLDEVYPQVETEVRSQLDSMLSLEDMNDRNFSDTDYQLAAYAAALRVLTSKRIEDIDVSHELTRTRAQGEMSPVEMVIRNAVAIACDHLVPRGIIKYLWKSLSPPEKFFLKGLEMESHGESRIGVYQELARGFGIQEYKSMLADTKANQSRLKTASEFGRKDLRGDGFAGTVLRQVLFGVFATAETDSPREAITWFMDEIADYASNRVRVIEVLEFVGNLRKDSSMVHWHKDAEAAAILAGALRNRQDNV
jgi:putative DNA methylase